MNDDLKPISFHYGWRSAARVQFGAGVLTSETLQNYRSE
jgi:hypothetical protein